MNTLENIQHRKSHGITTIKTAENTVPVFKLFMLISLFGKMHGANREPKSYGKIGEFYNVEIDMIKLSFFDMKFLLAMLKEIDNSLEINDKLQSDAIIKIEFDKIYERMGLNPSSYRKANKKKGTHETLKRLSKIYMQYGYNNKLNMFTLFPNITIDNFKDGTGYTDKDSFKTINVRVSKDFIDSSREATQKFIGMIEIPFLEKIGPVASNLYMYLMANTGFSFIPRSTLIDRLDLHSYAEDKNQNTEIKRAFQKLENAGVIEKHSFGYDAIKKRVMRQVNYTLIQNKKSSKKEIGRTNNISELNKHMEKRIKELDDMQNNGKKFNLIDFLDKK